jgi:hypothetical protein
MNTRIGLWKQGWRGTLQGKERTKETVDRLN